MKRAVLTVLAVGFVLAFASLATAQSADPLPDEAAAKGWTVVDMKQDWKLVFPLQKR